MRKMIIKYYARMTKKVLEENTHYENIARGDAPTPYIMTNEKDYKLLMKFVNKILEETKRK